MTICIPYKAEFNFECEANVVELRYCLRSIEKNLSGFGDIYIIGERPTGFTNYFFIESQEIGNCKDHFIYNKMLLACENDAITEDFIMLHDDHFLLKSLNINEMKYWHWGSLEKMTFENCGSKFIERINETKKRFPNGNFFDGHQPIVLNKEKIRELKNQWYGKFLFKTLYCNYHNLDGEYMTDCKITGCFPKKGIKEIIKDRLFFSTNAICKPTVEVLEELFPSPSKFEL